MAPDLRTQPGPHVFVDHLETPELHDHDRHHLTKSLRLRIGDPLTISDAKGAWRVGVLGESVLEATGPIHTCDPPPYEVGLGIALTKAAKPEFAVQKATELGIDTITVFQATHSVARWDSAKRVKNQTRLTRVAREAAMQSRRVTIPKVSVARDMQQLVSDFDPVRADFGGAPMNSAEFETVRFVLIGPEGGWSDHETALVPKTVDLGPTVLRAETAAVVASTFLTNTRAQRA